METIIKASPAKARRKFDATFKVEAVRNWLGSGKSAAVIAKELGLDENLLFAWRKFQKLTATSNHTPSQAQGRADASKSQYLCEVIWVDGCEELFSVDAADDGGLVFEEVGGEAAEEAEVGGGVA